MFENLGSALKKGFDKIAGAIFIDKKTIESVVKELQRALIMADVDIDLFSDLQLKTKINWNMTATVNAMVLAFSMLLPINK